MYRRHASTPGKRGCEDPLCVALHKALQNSSHFMISGYIKVYIPKCVPALIFEDYLKVGLHLSRICSTSFHMQIIYSSPYESPLFQHKFDVCHAPLCCAQRPSGNQTMYLLSLLANEAQKG